VIAFFESSVQRILVGCSNSVNLNWRLLSGPASLTALE